MQNIAHDIEIQSDEILNISIVNLLKKITNEFSGSQLRTLISQNAVKINKNTISDLKFTFTANALKQFNAHEGIIIVEIGKKKKLILKLL